MLRSISGVTSTTAAVIRVRSSATFAGKGGMNTQSLTNPHKKKSRGRWIGRAAPIAWPPRSPDLTPLDFVLWGFVKDRVFVPPLPANVAELRIQITAAVVEVTPEMLRSVWQDIDYRWDVCRITNGSHIEL
jgi:hypothetical protein